MQKAVLVPPLLVPPLVPPIMPQPISYIYMDESFFLGFALQSDSKLPAPASDNPSVAMAVAVHNVPSEGVKSLAELGFCFQVPSGFRAAWY